MPRKATGQIIPPKEGRAWADPLPRLRQAQAGHARHV